MTNIILSGLIASISDLKKHPMQVINKAKGQPIAILNRNQPVFYCISPSMFEALLDSADDEELGKIIRNRAHEPEIAVDINEL